MDKHDILEGLTFYRVASPESRGLMLAAARHAELGPGQILFGEGDAGSDFTAVGSGSIRVFRTGATGRQITLYHVRPGEASLVSMLSVLMGEPLLATGQAEGPTEVVTISATQVRQWAERDPGMHRFLLETVTRALVDVTAILERLAFGTVEDRLALLIADHLDGDGVISMRHDDIAAELGTAREVVSRLLEAQERRGSIRLSRGRIEVLDVQALQRHP
jgi:CRP/FNR family transcriptional regulator, anaerobic regulatory protein